MSLRTRICAFVSAFSRRQPHRRRRRLVNPRAAILQLEARQLLSIGAEVVFGPSAMHVEVTPLRPPSPEADSLAAEAPEAAPFPLERTFKLHSRPGATKRIYMDFNGHRNADGRWNEGVPFTTRAYSIDGNYSAFSVAEKTLIQQVWQRVTEDFAPFDVDVTTEEPPVNDLRNTGGGDARWGIRVVIGGDGGWFGGGGGIAFLTSFDWDTDTPAFVCSEALPYPDWEKAIAETVSHEVGHSLGLSHDGDAQYEYYSGHGSGATGWAPIMGYADWHAVSQWSAGQYAGASNRESDLQIITTQNGFGYRPDDHGNLRTNARVLAAGSGRLLAKGFIERPQDVDLFKFTVPAGKLDIKINPAVRGPNLDIKANLLNSAGAVIAGSNPVNVLNARLVKTVAAGTYFLRIDGVGKGTASTGYTHYASLGAYSINGRVGLSSFADPTSQPVALRPSARGIENSFGAFASQPETWAAWLRKNIGRG